MGTSMAVWAAIGAGVDLLTVQLIMPSSWLVDAVAVAIAGAYTVTPWARPARAHCREMCERESRRPRLRDAAAAGTMSAGGNLPFGLEHTLLVQLTSGRPFRGWWKRLLREETADSQVSRARTTTR